MFTVFRADVSEHRKDGPQKQGAEGFTGCHTSHFRVRLRCAHRYQSDRLNGALLSPCKGAQINNITTVSRHHAQQRASMCNQMSGSSRCVYDMLSQPQGILHLCCFSVNLTAFESRLFALVLDDPAVPGAGRPAPDYQVLALGRPFMGCGGARRLQQRCCQSLQAALHPAFATASQTAGRGSAATQVKSVPVVSAPRMQAPLGSEVQGSRDLSDAW